MKWLGWALVLALLAVALAVLAQFNDGNVVLLLPPTRIDLSLNFFLLLTGVVLVAVWWIARIVQQAADFPERVRLYRQRRDEVGSQRALRDALRALLEGRFARAERAARTAQAAPENAGLAALIGARAAHRMQQTDRRDEWLAQAQDDKSLDTARLVSSAEMWAEGRENERALEALDTLHATGSRHIHAARVALNANLQSGRWAEVLRGVRALEKRSALHPVLTERYKLLAWRETLLERRHDPAALEAAWNRIPTADRERAELALEGARLLNLAGRGRSAALAIEAALAKRWDERLLDEYARSQVFPARERIERAEGWLKSHPNDAALMRCLGLLCLREQLWGKARSYLDESLRLQTHPATLLALARLAETLGDEAQAARQYREAALGFANLAASGDGSDRSVPGPRAVNLALQRPTHRDSSL
ncbi:MAG: heme biosynthesis protein HemY [Burkholderiaceae bacterium]|nr:heme biosynthesis protein HemY [Burkholderiaceae bacterium]